MNHLEEQLKRTHDPLKKQFIVLEIEREKRKKGVSDDNKVLEEAKKYAAMANESGSGFARGTKKEFGGVDPYLLAR